MLSGKVMLNTGYKRWPNQVTLSVLVFECLLLTAYVRGERHGIESKTGAPIAGVRPEQINAHASHASMHILVLF